MKLKVEGLHIFMATVERFEDLDVWKRARELVNLIYDLSSAGSFAKDYGLSDQMRRAAVSIMSNIAEVFESRTKRLFIEYLERAKSSSGELRSQLNIARDRNYINQDDFDNGYHLTTTCSKQLTRFIGYLESQPNARCVREDGVSYAI